MKKTPKEIEDAINRYYQIYEKANNKKPIFSFEYQNGFIIRIEGSLRERWARFKDLIEATKRIEERITTTTKPIQWHKEETQKLEKSLQKAIKDAKDAKQLEQNLTKELEFKRLQIQTAESNGLTEFNNTTYLVTNQVGQVQ